MPIRSGFQLTMRHRPGARGGAATGGVVKAALLAYADPPASPPLKPQESNKKGWQPHAPQLPKPHI